MLKKAVLIAVVIVVVAVASTHWYFSDRGRFTTEPEYTGLGRTVSGNDLISDHDPAVILRFDPTFRHIGGQKFILYGVADTEQHFFVETTPDDKLKSVYWVQYEAYLPDNSYSYNYEDSPLRVRQVTLRTTSPIQRTRLSLTRTEKERVARTAQWPGSSLRARAMCFRIILLTRGWCI